MSFTMPIFALQFGQRSSSPSAQVSGSTRRAPQGLHFQPGSVAGWPGRAADAGGGGGTGSGGGFFSRRIGRRPGSLMIGESSVWGVGCRTDTRQSGKEKAADRSAASPYSV